MILIFEWKNGILIALDLRLSGDFLQIFDVKCEKTNSNSVSITLGTSNLVT